ncbi:MAG: hypothetical protein A2798_00725 [Candidatus Levybacteria bacterium RIFCSPHIGHO2_01_FULL_37_17]|nr:MAG: hypothetical protein A2798_00725 [Candidatus Levybacteria bacterium RIFCSPHIGHO2_01_FULL_37_17]OGH36977.1 MAG: hypothetical protein A2959_01585 [Candidatus Levybacteria bacterium RIFCSPLOWO2_01_FULL_38_23]
MTRSSTLFLKAAVLLIAAAVFFGMIRFPQTEGRATNLDLVSIYKDPFIIYIYIASISFFVALYQAFKLLGYVDKNKIFSQASVKAVRNIKYCAIALVAFFVGAETYLFIVERGKSDDIAGGVMMGLFIIFASLIVVAAADVFERLLQKTITKHS